MAERCTPDQIQSFRAGAKAVSVSNRLLQVRVLPAPLVLGTSSYGRREGRRCLRWSEGDQAPTTDEMGGLVSCVWRRLPMPGDDAHEQSAEKPALPPAAGSDRRTDEPARAEWRRGSIDQIVADATGGGEPNAYCEYLHVDPADAKRIGIIIGVGISGYSHAVDVSTVRHILKRHGPQGTADHSVTSADFARLPDVVGNPDLITPGGTKGSGPPRVEYRKRDGGNWLVVEEVRTGRGRLSLVTMFKEKATAS